MVFSQFETHYTWNECSVLTDTLHVFLFAGYEPPSEQFVVISG